MALAKGKKSEVRFIDTKTGDKFKLIYNPNDYRSDTIKQIPDNVLCLEKNTGMGSLVENYQYVFDAKYKVEMNPDEHYPDCSPGPKITDINTMHRYRDAIVYRNGEVNEKIIFGAYVLFPYPGSEEEYKSHHFYNSISTVNIGGLPFLPQKTKMVEEMLFRLVSESNVSAFERSILPKGIESRLARVDWSKQDVLVGSLSSADQFNTVLRDNYYYVPVRSMPQERIQVSYIAIYQSQRIFGRDAGIRYYGEVVYSDIRKRKAINNLPGRTSPEDYCYFYVISEWKKLDRRIDFEEEWVYKPRYTSLFLLKHCIKTFELFNIRSEEAYRLVYELRRVQKNIRVKDHPKDLFVKFNENISIYNDDRSIYVFFNGKTIIKRSTEVFAKHAGSVFLEMSKMIEKKETSANL